MSYDIYIGNTIMKRVEDEDATTAYPRIINGEVVYFEPEVEEMHHPDAPTFPNDDMTGNGNSRHPGYSAWSTFCERAGLIDLFFNKQDGLMREHPGYANLNEGHLNTIVGALERWKETHPGAVPGFEEFTMSDDAPDVGYDYTLARLIWLEWWVRYAVEHYEHAGISNW